MSPSGFICSLQKQDGMCVRVKESEEAKVHPLFLTLTRAPPALKCVVTSPKWDRGNNAEKSQEERAHEEPP